MPSVGFPQGNAITGKHAREPAGKVAAGNCRNLSALARRSRSEAGTLDRPPGIAVTYPRLPRRPASQRTPTAIAAPDTSISTSTPLAYRVGSNAWCSSSLRA